MYVIFGFAHEIDLFDTLIYLSHSINTHSSESTPPPPPYVIHKYYFYFACFRVLLITIMSLAENAVYPLDISFPYTTRIYFVLFPF